MANIIQDDNYYQISGWMINRLGLKGVALNVYAIIYGYSQAESNVFSGSRQYLADFIGVTRPTIDNALTSLLEKEYITKFSSVINGVTFVSYKANSSILQGVKNFDTPCKETLHNNKEYNKEKENSIKESCEIRNGNQVTTSIVASNDKPSSRQKQQKGTVTHTSSNTNMFIANNEQSDIQQKVGIGTETYCSTKKKVLYTISLTEVYTGIKSMYSKCGYSEKLHKKNTIQRLHTICTNKSKAKRLHPLQILMAYGVYLAECSQRNREVQYVKQSDSFLSNMVYDYAEKVEDEFKSKVVEKYGNEWEKYSIVD